MKKKSIALLMAMTIGMTGCGGPDSQSKDPQATQTVPAVSAEVTKEPVVTDEADVSETPNAEESTYYVKYPQVTVTTEHKEYHTKDGKEIMLYYWVDGLEIVGDEFPALANMVKKVNELHLKAFRKERKEYLQEAKELFADDQEEGSYEIMRNVWAERSDLSVFSMGYYDSLFRGGAHGGHTYGGFTFDTQTGRILSLDDIILDLDAYEKMAVPFVTEQVEDAYGEELFPEYKQTIKETIKNPNFVLTNYGLTIYYNEYELAPYATGTIEVQIPYSKLADYMKPEYVIQSKSPVMFKMEPNQDIFLEMNEKESLLRYETTIDQEESWFRQAELVVDGKQQLLYDDEGNGGYYGANCYYLRNADGKNYFILEKQADNDWRTLTLYQYENGKLIETDQMDCGIEENGVHSPQFKLNRKIDLLGSYSGSKNYYIDSDGKFATKEDRYELVNQIGTEWEVKLTVKKEVLTEVEGKEVTLKKGDVIRPIAAEDTKLYFLTEDGKEGFLVAEVNDESYGYTINGVEEEKIFKGIMYAG